MYLPDKFKTIIPPQDLSFNENLLQRLAAGDRQAFEWLYKYYCKKIYAYAYMITNNQHISEDLVHDVFIKLWLNKEKLKSVQNFNGYLYRLYKNLLLDKINIEKQEINVKKKYAFDSSRPVYNASDLLVLKEQEHAMEIAIRQLPKQRRVVYKLGSDLGWTRDKIATKLDISPFTVKCHMQKARVQLRMKYSKILR